MGTPHIYIYILIYIYIFQFFYSFVSFLVLFIFMLDINYSFLEILKFFLKDEMYPNSILYLGTFFFSFKNHPPQKNLGEQFAQKMITIYGSI